MKLKDWSLRNGQMGFSIQNLDRLGVDMRKRKIQKNEENILEGYYGTRHTSYSDNTPTIKMIIKHSKALDEGDQRYRNIEKIFLENELGERVLVPSKKPSVGRAFARHLAEGGQYNDERWNHIREISEDIGKLGGFVRATRSGQFNESVVSVVNEAANHYQSLRETIKRISGSRGYNHYFESWQPTLMETEVEQDYAGMFSASRLDPRIESAIPVLKKLNISVGELSEASEFESWANSIVEGRSPEMDKNIDDLVKLLQGDGELPVGADAMSIKGQLEDIIVDYDHRDLLFSELEDVARADPDNDAKPVITSWLQKHCDEEFYGDVLDKLGKNEPAPSSEIAKAPEPKKQAPQQIAPASSGGAEQFMPAPLAEKAKKPAQRNFVAKNAQRSGAGAHGKQGYQRHPKHKSKLGEEGVAEAKSSEESTLWRVEQSEATGRYHIVKGYQKRKVWKNSFGSGDFISRDSAQKKADELNGGVVEGSEDTAAKRQAERNKQRTTPAKKQRGQAQRKGLKQDKDGTYYAKKGVVEEQEQLDEINWRKGIATGAMALGALGALGAGGAAHGRVSIGPDGQATPSVAQQIQPGSQVKQSGGTIANQDVQTVEKVTKDDQGNIIITHGGNEYKAKSLPSDFPMIPRGAIKAKVEQAQMGHRGIGNYTVYLMKNGSAYLLNGAPAQDKPGLDEDSMDQISRIKRLSGLK